ncbi:hypothetical protein BP5796_03214 [Coleophoma crateriformis]|uniref:Extracellular membrane protein CFEM domain-containing protein n=1 Tax=Coleophoma crateriformis TaxID=565419 RepID=A0A3D8SMI6_9HELO|nr:hypothetical protein BP5796_03214 [Coleophoma crateriformis]
MRFSTFVFYAALCVRVLATFQLDLSAFTPCSQNRITIYYDQLSCSQAGTQADAIGCICADATLLRYTAACVGTNCTSQVNETAGTLANVCIENKTPMLISESQFEEYAGEGFTSGKTVTSSTLALAVSSSTTSATTGSTFGVAATSSAIAPAVSSSPTSATNSNNQQGDGNVNCGGSDCGNNISNNTTGSNNNTTTASNSGSGLNVAQIIGIVTGVVGGISAPIGIWLAWRALRKKSNSNGSGDSAPLTRSDH